jgi:hypothetical protein
MQQAKTLEDSCAQILTQGEIQDDRPSDPLDNAAPLQMRARGSAVGRLAIGAQYSITT